ncbi:MAG TPA: type VI secretion system tip protein TssI/VgrG, partial [Minicystis sp.]|nr:type VI secretion system tip protein TssI/VgrG [Minicystis sp.]
YRDGAVERRIHGVVHTIRDLFHTESQHLGYVMTFAPRAWPMSHQKRSEIFVDLAVPDIVKQKLQDAGLDLAQDAEFRLMASYPTRELVMQYEETDLDFVARLCEHVGISFFFEHQSGKDVIVFSDDNSGFKPIEGDASLPFYRRGEQLGVYALEGRTKTIPAKYHVKDYNYRTPTVSLVAESDVDPAGRGEVVEYGAHFKTPDEAKQIADIRAEELRATKRVFHGKSEVPRVASGARFTLDGHPRVEGELLVTEVRHEASQVAGGAGTGGERSYTNTFTAIMANVAYRPPRATPKPRVHGAISGIVEAQQPGQYAELDDQGRYHIRFMLDQGGASKGKASSLLRMAQPHAGAGYGFHFPLRAGVEVMLTCIDGDPDRPIITGAVPNPTTPTTVSSNNGTRNVIRTGSGVEMNIDDTEGSTRFKLSVPFANSVLQLGAPNQPTPGFHVGTDQQALVETGTSIALTAGTKIDVTANGGDITEVASAGMTLKANGGQINIDGSAGVFVEGHPTVYQHGTDVEIQGGATITAISPDTEVQGTGYLDLNSGTLVELQSGVMVFEHAPIVIIKGDGMVTITSPGAVMVNAPAVTVTGGTSVDVSAPTVNVTGGTTATVSAPTVNITGSGQVNVGSGVINVSGSLVKLNS